ncbi:MAG: hypothetical protein RhofKO_04090 [Rhodothermales bacterium]
MSEELKSVLSSVVVSATDAILVTEAEPLNAPGPAILYANEAFCRLTGYQLDEVVGKSPRFLQGPKTDREGLDRIREALEQWQPVTQELLNYRKDGTTFWVELSITPVANENGWFTHWIGVQREITDRKVSERALAESEARFRTLVNNLPGLVYRCTYDKHWRTLYMSDACLELTGYTVEQFEQSNRPFYKIIEEADRDRIRHAVAQAAQNGTPYEVEYRVRHTDGSVRWVYDKGSVMRGEDGRIAYLDGVMLDVTERKQQEARLRMLEAAVHDATESVLITETEMEQPGPRIVYVNPGFERMTGYTAEDVIGQTPRLLQGPQTDRDLIKHLRHQLASDQDFFGETINYRKDGTPFSIEWSISAVRNTAGEKTHYVAVQRDVTERRQIENRLRLLQQAVENATDAIIITESNPVSPNDTYVVYANAALRDVLGYAPEEVIGRPLGHTLLGSKANQKATRNALATMADGAALTVELTMLAKSGEPVAVESAVSPVHNASGAITHWVNVLRDLHESKRVEAERQAREQAEDMVRLKNTFINNMSHEIRTPLTAILGFTDVLRYEVGENAQEFVDVIEQSGERLLNTLTSILDLAKVESGTLELDIAPVDVAEAAREVMGRFHAHAYANGVTLNFTTDRLANFAAIDRAQLDQVFDNVVGNAIKFTAQGEVTVSVATEADQVVVRVRDTGIGIGEAFLPHVFDEFKQESNGLARSYEGSGLGLTITQRLVQLMKGRIEVESTKGVGTTFSIYFPLDGEAKQTLSAQAQPKLLLVEASPDIQALMQHILRDLVHVDIAADDTEALQLANRETYSLVMVDFESLNSLTPSEVLYALRALPTYRPVPIVALSGYGGSSEREQVLYQGFDEHVEKPFRGRHVQAVVRTLLKRYQSIQDTLSGDGSATTPLGSSPAFAG